MSSIGPACFGKWGFARFRRLRSALPIAIASASVTLAGCSGESEDPGTTPGGAAAAAGASSPGGSAGSSGGSDGAGGSASGAGGTGVGGGSGGTGPGGTTGAGGTGIAGSGGGGSTFPPVTDFAAPGPFQTTSGGQGPSCTIHRPQPLGEQGRKHPIIIWGNGTTATPTVYRGVLQHWATHGFIVAAANTSNAGSGTEMIACLEWVIEQNGVSGSEYYQNVDPQHVGASGHSQGGGGTLMAGRDERVTVTAPLQPYVAAPLGGFQRASIGEQNGPMFLMSGSADTIARPSSNQQPVYDGTNVPVFWGTLQGATHTGTAIGDIGGYRGPATAWFRLHLMGDESARSLFYGASCGLCNDSMWEVERKGIQ